MKNMVSYEMREYFFFWNIGLREARKNELTYCYSFLEIYLKGNGASPWLLVIKVGKTV